jgi:CHAT domain-containing protein
VVNPAFGNLTDVDGKPFDQLPLFESGIGQITQFYDEAYTRLLKGKDASPAEVMAEARLRDVIVFLTHAEASDNDPYEGSFIALAGDRLRVRDIAASRLDARLVIFGACETGRGRVTGDGILGLGRVTLAAGAEAMLVSIWHVPDVATLQLISDFHAAWDPAGRNAPLPSALREAQLSLLSEYPEQVEMWAGFIQVGDVR